MSGGDAPGPENLLEVLAEAIDAGFAGGVPEDHIEQARRFEQVMAQRPRRRCLDLGTGGGIPGLVLASWGCGDDWTLLDSSRTRTAFVERSIRRLGLEAAVRCVHGRAEELARRPDLRGTFDVVTSRSFGSPAVTAECATGFVAAGGALLVSEPPGSDGTRWSDLPGADLGLVVAGGPVAGIQVLIRRGSLDDRWPRRVGIPAKRPLFGG